MLREGGGGGWVGKERNRSHCVKLGLEKVNKSTHIHLRKVINGKFDYFHFIKPFLNYIPVPDSPHRVKVFTVTPRSVRITWRSNPASTSTVTRYMVKWLHVGNPADSNADGHKIVNAGSPYRREALVGGLKPFNMYSFMVREEVGQDNWSEFSAAVNVMMPEDGMLKFHKIMRTVSPLILGFDKLCS